MRATNTQTARAKDARTTPVARIPAPFSSLSRLIASPNRHSTVKPKRGKSRTIHGSTSVGFCRMTSKRLLIPLPLHDVERVQVEGVLVAGEGSRHCEGYGGLSGG